MHAEARLAVLEPLAVVDRTALVLVDTSAVLPALAELALVLVALGEQVDAIPMEFVVFPEAEVDVAIGEGVDSAAMPALYHLSNVLRPVVIAQLLELCFQLPARLVELAREFLLQPACLVLRLVALGVVAGCRCVVLVLHC